MSSLSDGVESPSRVCAHVNPALCASETGAAIFAMRTDPERVVVDFVPDPSDVMYTALTNHFSTGAVANIGAHDNGLGECRPTANMTVGGGLWSVIALASLVGGGGGGEEAKQSVERIGGRLELGVKRICMRV